MGLRLSEAWAQLGARPRPALKPSLWPPRRPRPGEEPPAPPPGPEEAPQAWRILAVRPDHWLVGFALELPGLEGPGGQP